MYVYGIPQLLLNYCIFCVDKSYFFFQCHHASYLFKKEKKTYTSQDLATAIQKLRSGELTAYAAAQKYKIPMTTLHDHVKTKDTLRQNAGRPIVLPLEDEKKLGSTIIVMEKWGFGLSRSEILEIVNMCAETIFRHHLRITRLDQIGLSTSENVTVCPSKKHNP